MKKTYTKPEIHAENIMLGAFGCYGDPDPHPRNNLFDALDDRNSTFG